MSPRIVEGQIVENKYEIIKELGKGGMGQVFLGRDLTLNRLVAVKCLNPEIAEKAAARRRFLDEGRSLAKAAHPNLPTIHYLGKDNDPPYMVMEFIEGDSLEKILKQHGPMQTDVAVPIFLEVLDGIKHAHGKGVVHRDIKPSNILLTHDGKPKVIDFGIAFDPDSERKTVAGSVIGTPTYISPEQARGEEIDRRSDIYSLGTVLFEMLTGEPPLEKGTNQATIFAHATQDAPPLPDEFGPALAAAVNVSLAQDKTKRHQTTDEFKAALESAVPRASLKPDSVTLYLEKSPRTTVCEIDPDDPVGTPPKPKAPAKPGPRRTARRIPWMVYASAGVFAVAVAIGLWVLKVAGERSEPIPPPAFVFQPPPPPKGWDFVSPVKPVSQPPPPSSKPANTSQPPAMTAAARAALEEHRSDLQTQLNKNLARLASLRAVGENSDEQSRLEKLCADMKDQLDSIGKQLSGR
jgi:serine/threonine protein kinase